MVASEVAIAAGAAAGALARWKVTTIGTAYGVTPWSTVGINMVGSFILGGALAQPTLPPRVSLLVGTGFCGAFTTFSTFSVDVVKFLEQKRYRAAAVYVLSTNALSIGASFVGYTLLKKMKTGRRIF
jgi:CrcB protein